MQRIEPKERKFVSKSVHFEWNNIQSYFEDLKNRSLSSIEDLKNWLIDRSELTEVLEEEFAWRYIRMNIDTNNEDYQKEFHYFVQNINPKIAPYEDALNRKLNDSQYLKSLEKEADYSIMLKNTQAQIELFREENIPILTKLEEDAQKFGSIAAKMSIDLDGKEYTLQQAAKLLKSTDRQLREKVYKLIQERRLQDKKSLDELFDHLIGLREKVAQNANFDNYRDYMFKAMGRFDYTAEDCSEFHNSIAETVVPLANKMAAKRKQLLKVDKLRPWDTAVDIEGKDPLKPFEDGEELVKKTIACFNRIDPFFGDCIKQMDEKKHLDLESKKGKAPGGFNYPLYESGLPFIFMNAVGAFRDVTTMVHEGGHAIHSVLTHPLDLVEFKSLTAEIAELASMSMELISMDHWDVFFDNEEDLKRAKRDQLLDVLGTLPWIATIDKFQHWVYTHPNHSVEERETFWLQLMEEFGSKQIDWSGLEKYKKNAWQKQLHLFEVPFYYIEYGMAQLGAVAIWKNYRENPKKAIEQYKNALSLGYTRSIHEVYEAAGVSFDFSKKYVSELMQFVFEEIEQNFSD
jgi:oligoendopeptidase F